MVDLISDTVIPTGTYPRGKMFPVSKSSNNNKYFPMKILHNVCFTLYSEMYFELFNNV